MKYLWGTSVYDLMTVIYGPAQKKQQEQGLESTTGIVSKPAETGQYSASLLRANSALVD